MSRSADNYSQANLSVKSLFMSVASRLVSIYVPEIQKAAKEQYDQRELETDKDKQI